MVKQLHKRFSDGKVKSLLERYLKEKSLIESKELPIKSYNYTYIRDQLWNKYQQKVSLPTIIDRAKKNGFYSKKPRRKPHDREVTTNYMGEIIQHDSSYHLWSPPVKEKWYLISSIIDDFSRFMLYARLIKKETSWVHIVALQTVFLKYGTPYRYYVDSHSIFRFGQGRDSFWRKHYKVTDEAEPQWKQVLNDCQVKATYALSPQARGKIERPYGWLQERLIRTCVRENAIDIKRVQRILSQELYRYNHRQVHSTTQEVPYFRFQRALKEKKSLFREFTIKPPYQSVKDIFCLRVNRTIDPYRKISFNNLHLKVNNATPREIVNLRIYPMANGLSEVRFWCNNRLIDVPKVKNSDLQGVYF